MVMFYIVNMGKYCRGILLSENEKTDASKHFHYNETTGVENDNTATWLTCLKCGEPLRKQKSNITCIDYYWKCDKCNIVIEKDINQLYSCCRCGRIIEKTEDLVFEFITPNWKELSWCNKPTGIGQYLCGKCHSRAIRPRGCIKYLRDLKNRIKNYIFS